MSPTILSEMNRTRYAMSDGDEHGWYRHITGKKNPSVLEVFLAELPERRHYEALEREEAAFRAAGNRSVCDACGERAVRHRTACTLGYPGHPGAEFTEYHTCEACGHSEM